MESVIIPMVRGPEQRPRYTLCVSSQSGESLLCPFLYSLYIIIIMVVQWSPLLKHADMWV